MADLGIFEAHAKAGRKNPRNDADGQAKAAWHES
jgi:hypothetical protein